MAIVSTDIVYRLSTTSGSAGNSTAGTPITSLGKYVSTTAWTSGTDSLFNDITGDQNAANQVDYRCFFVLNNNSTNTLINPVVYVSSEVAGGASVAIATDNVGATASGSASAQAASIASVTTAPSGVSAFSTPTTKATGLALANIAPGQVVAVWVRRTAANTAALNADGFTVTVAGDTAA